MHSDIDCLLACASAKPAIPVVESSLPVPAAPSAERLISLDALRGFDMFWIVGGAGIIQALQAFGDSSTARMLGEQMEHVSWEGFHFEDLIFPLFVFIAGTSLVFSTTRHMAAAGRAAATRRIVIRALLLFVLGVLANGGIAKGIDGIRWLGVLQRIAIAYLGAGLLFVWLKPRALIAVCVALLLGYWALLVFVPVPDAGAGNFAEGRNLTNYLDRIYLPGRKHDGDHDPEGLLSNLPAIASCLLGVFAGLWIRSTASGSRKAGALIVAGIALLAVGWVWSGSFPVIKKLWTSSFVLVAGGWSAILLGLFYYVIDVLGWRRGFTPFVWIGMNSITIYLLANLISFGQLAQRFAGGEIKTTLNNVVHAGVGDLLVALIACSLPVLVACFLFRRRIFVRV